MSNNPQKPKTPLDNWLDDFADANGLPRLDEVMNSSPVEQMKFVNRAKRMADHAKCIKDALAASPTPNTTRH